MKQAAARARPPGPHPGARPRARRRGPWPRRRRRRRRRVRAAAARRRCSQRPGTGSSTCTSRCSRAGAAPHPSSGRSSPATRRPACASWSSRRGSTPARSTRASARPIGADETAGELRARLVELGTALLVADPAERRRASAPVAAERRADLRARSSRSTSSGSTRERPATELARVVRAGNPRPGAWISVGRPPREGLRAHAARRRRRPRDSSTGMPRLGTVGGRPRARRGAARGPARDAGRGVAHGRPRRIAHAVDPG